jgi:hypothetical protein
LRKRSPEWRALFDSYGLMGHGNSRIINSQPSQGNVIMEDEIKYYGMVIINITGGYIFFFQQFVS